MKRSTKPDHVRYIAVARRLTRRYMVGDQLVIAVGGRPSRYARLEQLAFWRYVMGDSRAAAAARLAKVAARAQQIADSDPPNCQVLCA